MATWFVVSSPNPLNPYEVDSVTKAAGSAAPGDIVQINPGTWPGEAAFQQGVQVIGSNREQTILAGVVTFSAGSAKALLSKVSCLGVLTCLCPITLLDGIFFGVVSLLQGGDVLQSFFPAKSKFNYLGGVGIFKDSLIDSDFLVGAAIITGDNVQSSGAVKASVTSLGGANMTLTNSTFGAMANAGLAAASLGSSQSFLQTSGVSTISKYAIQSDVIVDSGTSTFSDTTIGKTLQVKPGGAVIMQQNCIIQAPS